MIQFIETDHRRKNFDWLVQNFTKILNLIHWLDFIAIATIAAMMMEGDILLKQIWRIFI